MPAQVIDYASTWIPVRFCRKALNPTKPHDSVPTTDRRCPTKPPESPKRSRDAAEAQRLDTLDFHGVTGGPEHTPTRMISWFHPSHNLFH